MKSRWLHHLTLILALGLLVPVVLLDLRPVTRARTDAHKQLYTCSMHPQVILEHDGPCPICPIPLTPLLAAAAAAPPKAAAVGRCGQGDRCDHSGGQVAENDRLPQLGDAALGREDGRAGGVGAARNEAAANRRPHQAVAGSTGVRRAGAAAGARADA